jgi:hypothetical protein
MYKSCGYSSFVPLVSLVTLALAESQAQDRPAPITLDHLGPTKNET